MGSSSWRWMLAGALALVFAASRAGAQTPQCPECKDHGVVACHTCIRTACKSTCEVIGCSEAIKCRTCAGTRLEECAKCEHAPDVDLAKRRDELAAWRSTLQPIDALIGHELMHCESPHFVLTFDCRRAEVPNAANPHEAMHVYLDRLESLFTRFCTDLACEPKDFCAKTHVMLWSRQGDQEKASVKYTLQQSSTESKLMGGKPVVSIYYDKNHLHEESELHQAIVHQVVHCLLSNVYDGIWPGNINGGWIDEGLAHYYEISLFGSVRHYCYVESDSIQLFEFGRWEPAVRAAVDKHDSLGFLSVTGSNTVDMTPEQRMFAWSFCDYIMRTAPGKIGRIAKGIKQKKSTTEVINSVLGVSPFEFEAAWKKWVVENYSLKKK